MSTSNESAQKYIALLDNGVDFIEAYIAVFPIRYAERCVREGFPVDMRMEALLYKNSKYILEQRNINATTTKG